VRCYSPLPAILKDESLTRLARCGHWRHRHDDYRLLLGRIGSRETAESNATQRVNAALVQAYGPVCIDRFKHQPNVEAKWAELTKIDTWRRMITSSKAASRHLRAPLHRTTRSRMHVQKRLARLFQCRHLPPNRTCINFHNPCRTGRDYCQTSESSCQGAVHT